jgi:hypothetical protein
MTLPSEINLNQLCEFVHAQVVENKKNNGEKSFQAHDGEELMVPWSQLSQSAQNRYREYAQWHIDGITEQTVKTKTAGA